PTPSELCGGAPGCRQRRAVALKCPNYGSWDFATAADGRDFVTLTTRLPDRGAFLFEVPPTGEVRTFPLGGPADAALVAIGPDSEPQVLLLGGGHPRLARRSGGVFTAMPVEASGQPIGLAVGADGAVLVLAADGYGGITLQR